MTEQTDRRADTSREQGTTREQILRAAAHWFAQQPYHEVGLDDILAEAGLTKGAMYFHFRSKHALALAIIDDQFSDVGTAVQGLIDRKLSGLETLVDIGYLIAVRDLTQDAARAVLNLVPAVGTVEGVKHKLFGSWIHTLAMAAERAVAEGDVVEGRDPQDVARVLLALYVGQRQVGDLNDPEQFLQEIQSNWALVLPGLVPPERLGYFSQFIRRRTAVAIRTASTTPG